MSKQVIIFVVKEDGILQKHSTMLNQEGEFWELDTSESVIQTFVHFFNLYNDGFKCLSCIKFSPFGNFAQLQYEDTDTVNQIEVYWSTWV